MAYCTSCGAYIPDGQTKCVACGADINEPSAQYATAKVPELTFEQPEHKKTTSTSERTGETPTAEKTTEHKIDLSGGKLYAILSYISVLCFLPFILGKTDEFTLFHAKQGILVLLISVLIDILGRFTLIGKILYLARIFFVVKGILNAYNGKMEPLPFIGQFASKF